MILYLALAALAVWRVAVMVVEEDGPWEMFARLRERAGIVTFPDGTVDRPATLAAGVLSCVRCASVWLSVPATVATWPGDDWQLWVLTPLALSGFAVLVESARRR